MTSNIFKYSLRKANPDDFMLAYDIRKNALRVYVEQTWGWDEQWQLKYHEQDFNSDILHIIEVEGKPAGSLEIFNENGNVKVSGLYITDMYQNLGIGTSIMYEIINNTSSAVLLQVLKVNNKAKRFYKRLGFKVCGENKTHFQMIYKK